ncbi:MAG: methyltransferase domain-containing protein [Patescibacteria group bacterium]|nr:methyltransferase domain-containing protein [Patescibacteria group bacterium]
MNKKPDKTSWENVAEWYDDLLEGSEDSFQAKVILPNLMRIVGPKPGMTVADIACGQGYFSRTFAAAGARVVSCDISKSLIEAAKSKPSAGIDYRVAPADGLSSIPDGSVDTAVIVLALQNIENIAGVATECARVLRPGGSFVFVLNHPAFRIPKESEWGWDEEGKVQYRRIDGYMSDSRSEIDMNPGAKSAKSKEMTVSFHRPLQGYFKALAKAGFAVTRLEEWISHRKSQKGPRSEAEDKARKEIPMFMAIEAEKM